MQIVDTGVLTPSFMDFSLPSEFAKSALYYCPQFGQFICNSDYRIERNGIDQYLLIYINSGSALCMKNSRCCRSRTSSARSCTRRSTA